MNNKITNAKHCVPKHTHQQSTMKSAVSDGSVPATQRLAPSKLYSSASTVLLISSSPPQLVPQQQQPAHTHTHPTPSRAVYTQMANIYQTWFFPPFRSGSSFGRSLSVVNARAVRHRILPTHTHGMAQLSPHACLQGKVEEREAGRWTGLVWSRGRQKSGPLANADQWLVACGWAHIAHMAGSLVLFPMLLLLHTQRHTESSSELFLHFPSTRVGRPRVGCAVPGASLVVSGGNLTLTRDAVRLCCCYRARVTWVRNWFINHQHTHTHHHHRQSSILSHRRPVWTSAERTRECASRVKNASNEGMG